MLDLLVRANEGAKKWRTFHEYIESKGHMSADTEPQRLAISARNCQRTTEALFGVLLDEYTRLVSPDSSEEELRAASAAVDSKRGALLSTLVYFERERIAWHERTSALGYSLKPTQTHPHALEVERRWAFRGRGRSATTASA